MVDRPTTRTVDSDVLHSEIVWLASFGWDDHAIARQLHCSIAAVESHLTGRDAVAPSSSGSRF